MDVLFSPPDITEREIAEVVDTLRSGWITTGPKTKLFEKNIAEFCHTSIYLYSFWKCGLSWRSKACSCGYSRELT